MTDYSLLQSSIEAQTPFEKDGHRVEPPPAYAPGGNSFDSDADHSKKSLVATGRVIWVLMMAFLCALDVSDDDGDAVVMLRGSKGAAKALAASVFAFVQLGLMILNPTEWLYEAAVCCITLVYILVMNVFREQSPDMAWALSIMVILTFLTPHAPWWRLAMGPRWKDGWTRVPPSDTALAIVSGVYLLSLIALVVTELADEDGWDLFNMLLSYDEEAQSNTAIAVIKLIAFFAGFWSMVTLSSRCKSAVWTNALFCVVLVLTFGYKWMFVSRYLGQDLLIMGPTFGAVTVLGWIWTAVSLYGQEIYVSLFSKPAEEDLCLV